MSEPPAMVTVHMCRVPFRTTHFNANQKVWVVTHTGDLAALCTGKFRGRGRYVTAWVKWGTATKVTPVFKDIEVAQTFAETHQLGIVPRALEPES